MVLTNDEELAMSIAILQSNTFKKGDAHTKPHHGLSVECCEADDEGPSDKGEKTEV